MMELSNVLFSAKYWVNLQCRWPGKRRDRTAKMLTATQNIDTNEKYRHKIAKETHISKLCCSCVRLLVHRFIFSVLPGKNICDRHVVDENNFSKYCLFGKKIIWGFLALTLKKIVL